MATCWASICLISSSQGAQAQSASAPTPSAPVATPPQTTSPTTPPPFSPPAPTGLSQPGASQFLAPAPFDAGPANNNTVALRALPVTSGDIGATGRKWYTITVSLRESYDDNPNTVANNKQTAYETSLSPSLLVDFPTVNGGFTGAVTGNATYYDYVNNKGSTGTTNGGGSSYPSSLQYNAEVNGQFQHAFSDRFQLSLADDARYYTDPDFFQSIGTYYQNGPYINNSFSGSLTAQFTPLVGTSTSYNNATVHYLQNSVGTSQDNVQNTFSQGISFAILPKISLNFGGTFDNSDYGGNDRGYTSYTGYTGVTWTALPSLSFSGSIGGTYTETTQTGSNPDTQVSPYANISANWTLGAKSSLSFNYSHAITPAQDGVADGQESDRASATFSYQITPSISTHLTGIYTLADITPALVGDATTGPYDETSYGVDTGISYSFNSYLSFDADLTVTGVSSTVSVFNYSRNQASIGVRGTY